MSKLKAVILVGGPGTRLQPLTYEKPKAMVPVLNLPFMEHVLARLKQAGVGEVVMTLNYLPEAIRDYFGDGGRFGLRLEYCLEPSPLGTAGAVKNAEAYLDTPFLVLNGDVFTDLDITDMFARHQANRAMASIALYRVEDTRHFGVVETEDDWRVRRFVEKPHPGQTPTKWINAGTYILEPEMLKYIPADTHYMFENGLFPAILERGEPVYGYPYRGYWLDIGTPAKYLSLNCDLLLDRTRSPLADGLGKDTVKLGRDVAVDPSAGITPPAVIGDGCRIGKGVRIKGPAVIGDGCRIEDGASLEEAVLWKNVSVGARARLRRCIISSHTVIGPDEEISASAVTRSDTTPFTG